MKAKEESHRMRRKTGFKAGFFKIGHHFPCQRRIGDGGGRRGTVFVDGEPFHRGLDHGDASRDDRVEDFLLEVGSDLLGDFGRDFRAGIKHRQDEAEDFQVRVVRPLDLGDGGQELAKGVQGEVFALDGRDEVSGGTEGIQRQKTQEGRAVDEDEIIEPFRSVIDMALQKGQEGLSAFLYEVAFQQSKRKIGWDEMDMMDGSLADGTLEFDFPKSTSLIVSGKRRVDAESAGAASWGSISRSRILLLYFFRAEARL